MLAAARMHLASRGQPDMLTAHFEYASRTAVGPAIIVVDEIKLGQQLSTLHLTLWQGRGLLAQAPWVTPGASRRAILGYVTQADLAEFAGVSLPTGHEGTPAAAPAPAPDFDALRARGADEAWQEARPPPGPALRTLRNWHLYVPRAGALAPGVLDMWIRPARGVGRITAGALPYVADSFPYDLHLFIVAPELRQLLESRPDPAGGEAAERTARREELQEQDRVRANMWFPTLVMNLEVKEVLPAEGVEWLSVRVTSRQIKNGKFDIDIVIRDADGEIIALSNHVAMSVSMEKNTSGREAPKAAL